MRLVAPQIKHITLGQIICYSDVRERGCTGRSKLRLGREWDNGQTLSRNMVQPFEVTTSRLRRRNDMSRRVQ